MVSASASERSTKWSGVEKKRDSLSQEELNDDGSDRQEFCAPIINLSCAEVSESSDRDSPR